MNESSVILIINCSSSSIKFSALNTNGYEVLVSGIADGISPENAFLSVDGGEPAPLTYHNYEGALKATAFKLEKWSLNDDMVLIGHRIAHGDGTFTESAIITGGVIGNIRHISPLAPLYDYVSLDGIESAQQLSPDVIQVAIFDISFHQTTAPEACLCDLPWKYYEELGVRRYSFHGTSHYHASRRAHSLLNPAGDDSSPVVAHLGSDASVCVVHGGQDVDTSMGVMPLESLMMSTCSGDVDLGVMSWVVSQANQSLGELRHIANKKSGLLGISGLPSDLRVLERAWYKSHERTQLAIKTSVYRTARRIAGHAASLHRLDGATFTDGIGESLGLVRRLVTEHLVVSGIEIDTEMSNRSDPFGERIASSENAHVICTVTPTNGERMTALGAIRLGKVNTSTELA